MTQSKDSENRILNDIEKMGKTLEKVLERIACMEANDAELKMKVDMFIDSSYRNQKEVKYRIEKNEEMIEKNKTKNDQKIKDLERRVNMILGGLILAGAIIGVAAKLL